MNWQIAKKKKEKCRYTIYRSVFRGLSGNCREQSVFANEPNERKRKKKRKTHKTNSLHNFFFSVQESPIKIHCILLLIWMVSKVESWRQVSFIFSEFFFFAYERWEFQFHTFNQLFFFFTKQKKKYKKKYKNFPLRIQNAYSFWINNNFFNA